MPRYTVLRSRLIAGAALLVLGPGCAVDQASSNAGLGASSGGGAAFYPAPSPAAAKPAVVAGPRIEAPTPARVMVPADARPSRSITVTASGGEVIELAAVPAHGTVAIAGSGGAAPSLSYTPTPGYSGTDQFSVSLGGGRRTVTVSIGADRP